MKKKTDKYRAAKMTAHLREFCLWYHKPRKDAKQKQKVKKYMLKKDGTPSKRYNVFYKCEDCGEIFDKVHMDHIIPVGKAPVWPYEIEELITYIRRLLSPLENWQVLCEGCHKLKTEMERNERAKVLQD